MASMRTPEEVVRAVGLGVSRLVTGRLTEAEREEVLDELAALYGEETDVRHPFAPFGDTPLRSRAELRRHFAEGAGRTPGVETFAPVDVVVHRTADPEVVVEEFRYEGRANGQAFSLPCVFVVRVRDGVIVESRDYTNRVALARAFGRLDELAAALAAEAAAPE
jgi:uncharacterized protein